MTYADVEERKERIASVVGWFVPHIVRHLIFLYILDMPQKNEKGDDDEEEEEGEKKKIRKTGKSEKTTKNTNEQYRALVFLLFSLFTQHLVLRVAVFLTFQIANYFIFSFFIHLIIIIIMIFYFFFFFFNLLLSCYLTKLQVNLRGCLKNLLFEKNGS